MIRKMLSIFGLEIKKINRNITSKKQFFTMQSALERCFERGLNVKSVIDVGASDGRWSEMCLAILPKANYLLVEAQEGHVENLAKFCEKHSTTSFVHAAAGPSDGKVYFDEGDLFGGLASTEALKNNCIEVDAIALDNEINRRKLEPPYLLKLDTHGFELPILEGAKQLLKLSELVIIETYNYKLTNDSLKYYEMCHYMEKLGFSPIEMVDFELRTYDNSFWQMDTFFIKSSNTSFNYNSYK